MMQRRVVLTGLGSLAACTSSLRAQVQTNAPSRPLLLVQGQELPDSSMIMGAPTLVVRSPTPEQIERPGVMSMHYVEQARHHHLHVGRAA